MYRRLVSVCLSGLPSGGVLPAVPAVPWSFPPPGALSAQQFRSVPHATSSSRKSQADRRVVPPSSGGMQVFGITPGGVVSAFRSSVPPERRPGRIRVAGRLSRFARRLSFLGYTGRKACLPPLGAEAAATGRRASATVPRFIARSVAWCRDRVVESDGEALPRFSATSGASSAQRVSVRETRHAGNLRWRVRCSQAILPPPSTSPPEAGQILSGRFSGGWARRIRSHVSGWLADPHSRSRYRHGSPAPPFLATTRRLPPPLPAAAAAATGAGDTSP